MSADLIKRFGVRNLYLSHKLALRDFEVQLYDIDSIRDLRSGSSQQADISLSNAL